MARGAAAARASTALRRHDLRRLCPARVSPWRLTKPQPYPSGMRKGLANYGDAGFSLFLRKAFIKAMGYSDSALDRPIVGITNTFSGYNACHRNVPDLIEAIKRGVMLAGGLPIEFPDHLDPRILLPSDLDVPAQPDGDGRRGDDPRPADGFGGADRRLRQDRAGAADGGGERRPAGDHGSHRPDDHRQLSRRKARRLHRLPALLGDAPRRQGERGRNRGDRRQARARPRHLHGDGHGEHHGAGHRGAGHDAARRRARSRRSTPTGSATPRRPAPAPWRWPPRSCGRARS